jgi:hypothetical protein
MFSSVLNAPSAPIYTLAVLRSPVVAKVHHWARLRSGFDYKPILDGLLDSLGQISGGRFVALEWPVLQEMLGKVVAFWVVCHLRSFRAIGVVKGSSCSRIDSRAVRVCSVHRADHVAIMEPIRARFAHITADERPGTVIEFGISQDANQFTDCFGILAIGAGCRAFHDVG